MAVEGFGASHVVGGIYLLPDGENYCGADGTLHTQDVIDQYHGVYSCWRCGGAGVLKMYLTRGYDLVRCEVCHGSTQSSLMPLLQPRHSHDWQTSEDKGGPQSDRQRCECGAVWHKKRERAAAIDRVAGLIPLGALLTKKEVHMQAKGEDN